MPNSLKTQGPLDTAVLLRQLVDDGLLEPVAAKRAGVNPPRKGERLQHPLRPRRHRRGHLE